MWRKQLSAFEQLRFDFLRKQKEGMIELCVSPYAQASILHVLFPFRTRSKGMCTPPWPSLFLYIHLKKKKRILSLNLSVFLCPSLHPQTKPSFIHWCSLFLPSFFSQQAPCAHPILSSVIHPVLWTRPCTSRPNGKCAWPPQRGCGTHDAAEQDGPSLQDSDDWTSQLRCFNPLNKVLQCSPWKD